MHENHSWVVNLATRAERRFAAVARDAASCVSNASTKAISLSTLVMILCYSPSIMLNMVSHGVLVADAEMSSLLELFQHVSGVGVGGVLP